jgi:phosphoglycerate dehydrogenase-like enzyme
VRRAVLNFRDTRDGWAIPDWAVREIRDALPGWEVVEVQAAVDGRGDGGGVSDEALRAVAGAEVYLGYGLPRELLNATGGADRALRWVHTGTAGVGSLLYPELRDAAVVLTNSAGVHAAPMAESALAMILHFARGLDHAVRAQHARQWDPSPFESAGPGVTEIQGRTVGIIGFGGIGREVAWRAYALGLRVLATRRGSTRSTDLVELLAGREGLLELLGRSDYVVLCVPGTPETYRLIGAPELAVMKAGAVLVNLSRGSVVDEAALVAALEARRLRGAALDVFEAEPLPAESPLWTLPNVLITPHVSATSPRFWRRQTDLIVDNIHRYLTGEPLRNRVDRARGY